MMELMAFLQDGDVAYGPGRDVARFVGQLVGALIVILLIRFVWKRTKK